MFGRSLFSAAKSNQSARVVSLLDEKHVDINSVNPFNRTAFYFACENGNMDIIQILLDRNADIEKTDDRGWTPCYVAAREGHVDVVRLLHEYGADLNQANNNGATPCYIAAREGHVDVVRLLHDYGADIERPKNNGQTPLQVANEYNQTEVVRALEELIARDEEEIERRIQQLDFTPLSSGDKVVKGPHWNEGNENSGNQGEVMEVNGDQVRVRWSMMNKKWYQYSNSVKEVISSNVRKRIKNEMREEKKTRSITLAEEQKIPDTEVIKEKKQETEAEIDPFEEDEAERKRELRDQSSNLQYQIMNLITSLKSQELLTQFQSGAACINILIDLFEDDCECNEKDYRDIMKSEFNLVITEAKKLSSLIQQLKEVKDQLGSDFEELPFETESSIPSFHTRSSSISSPLIDPRSNSQDSSMMIGNLEVSQAEMDKLQHSGTGKGTHILHAFDTYNRKDVILKAFEEEASAVREYENLNKLRSRHVVSVFGCVIPIQHGGSMLYGVVMEKGEEDLRAYIERKHTLSSKKREDIGFEVIQALHFIHSDCQMVWHDCKPSNFVRYHDKGDYVVKAIDVEHALDVSVAMGEDHGHTVRFASPEVVRGRESLTSCFSMDMWCLGVTLLFVAKGKDLADLLFPEDVGEEGTHRLRNLYLRESDSDLQQNIDSMLDRTFSSNEANLRSLIGHLLKVDVNERYSILQVLSHAYVAGGHGTTTKRQMDISSKVDTVLENQDEMKDSLEDQTLSIEFMREEMG